MKPLSGAAIDRLRETIDRPHAGDERPVICDRALISGDATERATRATSSPASWLAPHRA